MFRLDLLLNASPRESVHPAIKQLGWFRTCVILLSDTKRNETPNHRFRLWESKLFRLWLCVS
jgi:hypothetical protein